MRPVLAIAVLVWRSAMRSGLLPILGGVLAAAVCAVPSAVRGDGTLQGELAISIVYTLGLAVVVLSAVTIWTAAAAISREVSEKRIRLVMVKPVNAGQVWFGKWLGIFGVNLMLLTVCGVAIGGLLQWKLYRWAGDTATRRTVRRELLSARREIAPRPESLHAEAAAWFERLQQAGHPAAGTDRASVLARLERQLARERALVPPGGRKRWVFEPEPVSAANTPYVLDVRCGPYVREQPTVSGVWYVGTEQRPEAHRFEMRDAVGNAFAFPLPPGAAVAGEPLVVTFVNGPADNSSALFFQEPGGVRLTQNVGGFAWNFVRALLVLLLGLGMLGALGLTAGALFSRPVAVFLTCAVVLLVLASQYFVYASQPEHRASHHHHHGEGEAAEPHPAVAVYLRAGEAALRRLGAWTAPAVSFAPLRRLRGGLWISWGCVLRAFAWLTLVYSGLTGALGVLILHRRELAWVQ